MLALALAAPARAQDTAPPPAAALARLPADPCLKPDPERARAEPIPICRYDRFRQPRKGRFEVLNGEEAKPTDYPAQFYYYGDSGLCTASLIAEKAMITAAHCVADGGTLSARLTTWSGAKAIATCRHATATPDAPKMDIAVCSLDKRMSGPYQRINRDQSMIVADGRAKVTIVGFGCGAVNEPEPEHPVFRRGTTTAMRTEGGALFTSGGASVCLGDSGGPAFVQTASGWIQIAVNSRGADDLGSWLSLTSDPNAAGFIERWATQPDIKQHICWAEIYVPHCQ